MNSAAATPIGSPPRERNASRCLPPRGLPATAPRMLVILCPTCGRTAEPHEEHCRWDGTSLAGGLPRCAGKARTASPRSSESSYCSSQVGRKASTGDALASNAIRSHGHVPENLSEWPPKVFAQQKVSVADLESLNLPTASTDYLAVGGGLGSFVWADILRVSGVAAEQILVTGPDVKPYGHYETLAHNSQIPEWERIRSNSESRPDNLWGWPGYALGEVWRESRSGHFGAALNILWRIFGEPTLAQTYTPKLGDVFDAIDREADRIGWDSMVRPARVHAIRKTDDGRYAIAYSRLGFSPIALRPSYSIILAKHVHLAVGYPGLKVLDEVRRYREETGDFDSVVSAYEAHDHIYDHLREHGGTVILRGRGIVASRVLQRLHEERRHNPNITVTHVMRSPRLEGHRYGRSRRRVKNHFEFQPFNWPRGAWGGEQRNLLENSEPERRKELLEQWGGTTTARRHDWIEIVEKGLREGWYQVAFGQIERFERQQRGPIVASFGEEQPPIPADFVIDATGLETGVEVSPLLKDLVEHYDLELNPLGRLPVENDFEVPGMRNGEGRVYAAGAMTLGGPHAGVDTFLGLQYAARRSVDALAVLGAPSLRRLNGVKSIVGWAKWALGITP